MTIRESTDRKRLGEEIVECDGIVLFVDGKTMVVETRIATEDGLILANSNYQLRVKE